jgi:hypothetical protein
MKTILDRAMYDSTGEKSGPRTSWPKERGIMAARGPPAPIIESLDALVNVAVVDEPTPSYRLHDRKHLASHISSTTYHGRHSKRRE